MKSKIFRKIGLNISINEIAEQGSDIKKGQEEENDKEYLVKTIGAFGLWQGIVFITGVLTRAIANWNVMSMGFLTPVEKFVCVEFADNFTEQVEESTCYDNCIRYNYSSFVGKTIIEDFELICKDAWLASFTQSILMFGLLLGVSTFGWISDRFGRRTALVLSTLINAVSMVALPFAPNYITFCAIRLVVGFASGGNLTVCVAHGLEIIGSQYREVVGALYSLIDGLAEASLAGFAILSSDWQGYTMSYGIAACIIFVFVIFIPESPRWLVSKGRVDEAIKVITSAAKRNKMDTSNITHIITKAAEDMKLQAKDTVQTTYLDFFKTKDMFVRSLIVFAIWFASGLCFFGIYQYETLISSDPYVTVVILGLLLVPLYPVIIILSKFFGRKLSSIGTFTITGITMLILIFIPTNNWFGILVNIVSFSCLSIYVAISYIYVVELFPTPLRGKAIGLASCGAKIGAMIAPFIANLVPRWLPSLIFGIFPIAAALCGCLLPETIGIDLNDTLE